MSENNKLPLWVLLAFSSIPSRKAALILIWVCIAFTVYCLPWANYINDDLVTALFLIDDWSWAAMMIPICLWYYLSLRWMDKNEGWEKL